jgi:hypothetical protein
MRLPNGNQQYFTTQRQNSGDQKRVMNAVSWTERDDVENQSQQVEREGAAGASCALRRNLRRPAPQNTAALR